MWRLPGGRSSEPDARRDRLAAREPFYSVVTAPEFLSANLTDDGKREFYWTGEELIDAMFHTIQFHLTQHFVPMSILEYGCGAGRLAIPLAIRAARRSGRVVAVDASAPAIETARREAFRVGVDNVTFQSAAEFFASDTTFDFVNCYFVLQRIPPADGMGLVRHLLGRIRTGGVGAFQFPYRITAPALVRASRHLRTALPAVNGVANLLRGKPIDEPFSAPVAYGLEDVLGILKAASLPAAHLVFESHAGFASVIVFVEIPMNWSGARGEESSVPAPPTREKASSAAGVPSPIDVREIIEHTTIEELNRAAEQYFATLTDHEYHLAKPFATLTDAPPLLLDVVIMLQGLQLTPESAVLEFGAGTGWFSRFLTQLGCRVILLDVSPTALELARELYERLPVLGHRPAPEFLLFDGRHIDLPDASVDRIVSLHAFHHVANPDEVLVEFSRILKPGGIVGFAEPGPEHSKSALSQFEMKNYGVVENDVDVHAIWRSARKSGFQDLKVAVFNGLPFSLALADFEDLVAGGPAGAGWMSSTRAFLRNLRSFFLFKPGATVVDSHSTAGLACEIFPLSPAVSGEEGQAVAVEVIVTNSGTARWLASDVEHGGVTIGAHLYDAAGKLLKFEVDRRPPTDPPREIGSGESVRCRLLLPPQAAGRYVLEVDCVSNQVIWFAQIGSQPARVEIEITAAEQSPPA